MKPVDILMRWGAQLVFERPVRKLPLEVLLKELNHNSTEIAAHLSLCLDSPINRRRLSHMIGIERWGQRRLRVALGEPFLTEEYNHYQPSGERTWEELKNEWFTTRLATTTLAEAITGRPEISGVKVFHNTFGPLSIKGWLRYLGAHANSEGKHIK